MVIRTLGLCLIFLSCSASAQNYDAAFDQQQVQTFINYMVTKHHFKRAALEKTLSEVKYDPSVIKLMERPYEAMPWRTYLKHFIDSDRILAGLRTWHAHEAELQQIEQTYHVPPAIIIAILGMESYYGHHQATHDALPTLCTLSFAYPKRSKFFTAELEALFLLSRDQDFPLHDLRGSYAGALGMPQFMPSNYLRYAVDTDQKNHADLFHSMSDSMASIAQFLKHFGWQEGQPVLSHANFLHDKYTDLPLLTQTKVDSLAHIGHFKDAEKNIPDLMVLRLEDSGKEAWLAWPNFFALLHYNRSMLYALNAAVFAAYLEEAHEQAYG
jgi:membrane-bound lytic murein transglycosylase B